MPKSKEIKIKRTCKMNGQNYVYLQYKPSKWENWFSKWCTCKMNGKI